MRFIVDENIPRKVPKALIAKGFDVLIAPRKSEDIEIGKIAQRERRIILSQDKDFTNSVIFPPKNFHGIIRIRIHPPIASDILNALENLFFQCSPEDLEGELILVERDGFRVV